MALGNLIVDAGNTAQHHPSLLLLLAVCAPTAVCIYLRFFYVDFKRIEGIPEVPGGSLLYGHLPLLGGDHASATENWAKQYGWPVFQARLGYRRVIFLNGFEAAREWLVTHQAATIDRPKFYTFHGVVSKTSAATIGSNPWSDRTRKQRLVVGSLTTAPAIKRLAPMIDLETQQLILSIAKDGNGGATALVCHRYLKRLALNIVLMFCYGRRFDSVNDPLLLQILSDASIISSFRSTNANTQDYVPYLRYLPNFLKDRKRKALATAVRERRDKWLAGLLQEVERSVAAGKPSSCVAAGLLSDSDSGRLVEYDIRTILGGLMSGGFETVFSTAIAGFAYLAGPDGRAMQQKAYDDIIQSYGSPKTAFEDAVHEEKSAFVVAFVRETLRYYPPIHLLPPRQTYKAFRTKSGAEVPSGMMLLVNCQAANHDTATFGPDANLFRPERWLDKETQYNVPAPFEFAFGAGSRMCTAVNFSNRILYTIFVRLIVSFRIKESKLMPPDLHYVHYNRDPTVASACPKDFEAFFELRDSEAFDVYMRKSAENTSSVNNGIVR